MLSFIFTPVGGGMDLGRRAFRRGLFGKAVATVAMIVAAGTAQAAPPVVTTPGVVDVYYSADAGQDGMYFSFRVTATGEPTRFEATGLPSWCTFDTSSGNFFGSTQTPGVANVTVSAVNADGTGTATVQIRCHPSPIGVRAPSGVFYPGETILFDVDFNAVVHTSGSPTLKFRIGTEDYREASLDSGGGTNSLRFAYLVRDDERSGDVMVVGLETSGGAIADANGLGAGTSLPLRHVSATARVEARALAPLGDPGITLQPDNVVAAAGTAASLRVESATGATYQWRRNGLDVNGATSATLTLPAADAAHAGVYTAVVNAGGTATETRPAVLGVTTSAKVIGAGVEIAADILHPNGNRYDQILLQGPAAAVTADAGQVTRISFRDLSEDIVQVEFSGAGTLSIALDNFSGAGEAVNYNQPGVSYVKGHARLIVAGANETTYLSVFSVGRANAVNQALFKTGVDYDGVADVASVAVVSANGRFGGIFAGNASFVATEGIAGLLAQGVAFNGSVVIGDVSAANTATPVLLVGSVATLRIAGGDLAQPNGRAISVGGIDQISLVAGTTSHGETLPAQMIGARLVGEDGSDVTARLAGTAQ